MVFSDPQKQAWPLQKNVTTQGLCRPLAPESEVALSIPQTFAARTGRAATMPHAAAKRSRACLCLPSLSQTPGCTLHGSRKDSIEVRVLLVA